MGYPWDISVRVVKYLNICSDVAFNFFSRPVVEL